MKEEFKKAVQIVEDYLKDRIDSGELSIEFIHDEYVEYSNEFIAYSILLDGLDCVVFQKTNIEIIDLMIYRFIMPQTKEDFLKVMEVLDR